MRRAGGRGGQEAYVKFTMGMRERKRWRLCVRACERGKEREAEGETKSLIVKGKERERETKR